MTLLLSPVVVKLPNARGVSRERLGVASPIALYLRQSPPAPLNVGIPSSGCAIALRQIVGAVCPEAYRPDAADRPAPATAMICFEALRVDMNPGMSSEGREDID